MQKLETLLLLIWITLTILMCNFEVCMVGCTKHVKQVWIFSHCGSITVFKNKSPLPFKHVCMRHTLGFTVGSQSLPFCCSYSVDNLHHYPEIIIIVPKRLDTENKWKKKTVHVVLRRQPALFTSQLCETLPTKWKMLPAETERAWLTCTDG